MNFKEVYKSANDEIHGNRALIEKVMQKTQKKSSSKVIYSFACIAAVAVIVVAISLYPKNSGTTTPQIQVVSNKDNDNSSVATNIYDNEKNDIPKKDEAVQNYRYQNDTEISQDVTETAEKTEITEYDFDTFSAVEENTQVAETSENKNIMMDTNDAISSAGAIKFAKPGSGSGSSAESISYEGVTAEQYYDYIGTDITKKVVLPDGMNFEAFYGTVLKRSSVTGDLVSDDAEFYATGNNKKLSISVSRLSGEVYNKLNDSASEKTNISGTTAVIETNEKTYRIYAQYAGVYYKIYAEGFSLEEIQNVLLSICSN